MYVLKAKPEDFMVEEQSSVKSGEQGTYMYFLLKKKNHTTAAAAQGIADALHIPLKNIGYAGNKDRAAVTTQYLSIKGTSPKKVAALKLKDISLQLVGYGEAPISLGDLVGNKFKIIVRNIEEKPKTITQFVNYYDAQRFSKHNHLIGRLMVQRNFLQAAQLMDHDSVLQALRKEPTNAIAAIRTVPRKVLMLYVNAYQSWLWNETVKRYLAQYQHTELPWKFGILLFPAAHVENVPIPLVGFHMSKTTEPIQGILNQIMQEEGITKRSFVLKELPYLSAEGGVRELMVEPKNLRIGALEEDELHPGKKKIHIHFFLPKGSYATMYAKALFP